MTKNNLHTQIIVRDVINSIPYWASDETLPKVKSRFKRLTGKYPSKNASIMLFSGNFEDLDKIQINDLGDIIYRSTVTKITLQ